MPDPASYLNAQLKSSLNSGADVRIRPLLTPPFGSDNLRISHFGLGAVAGVDGLFIKL
jgi:hypothetical protein